MVSSLEVSKTVPTIAKRLPRPLLLTRLEYDLSATTFSPDGRIFQIEYASKAVENSGTVIGIRAKDGVVLAVEKPILSKLLKAGVNRRIHTVELHAGVVGAGLIADCRALAQRARSEGSSYRESYDDAIPGPQLAERLSLFMQAYTLYGSVRPFCATLVMGAVDADGPHLYMMEPSGLSWGHKACVAGKGRQAARTELEKLDFDALTVKDAVVEAAKIIYLAHDKAKDKEFELEISWIGPESNNLHQIVPATVLENAIRVAKENLASRMEYD